MMKQQHTPGPWTVRPLIGSTISNGDTGKEKDSAGMWTDIVSLRPSQEANARLIAAIAKAEGAE